MDTPSVVAASLTPISVWNIILALLTFSLACTIHPLGSTIHSAPMVAFYRTIHLLYNVIKCSRNTSLRCAIERVVRERLVDNADSTNLDPKQFPPRIFLSLPRRTIISGLCILQYTKLCGYHGIPTIFFVCTILVISLVVMEFLYLAGTYRPNNYNTYTTPAPRHASSELEVILLNLQFLILVLAAVIMGAQIVISGKSVLFWFLWFAYDLPASLFVPWMAHWELLLRGWLSITSRQSSWELCASFPIFAFLYLPGCFFILLIIAIWGYLFGVILPVISIGVGACIVFWISNNLKKMAILRGAMALMMGFWCVFGYNCEGTRKEWWVKGLP